MSFRIPYWFFVIAFLIFTFWATYSPAYAQQATATNTPTSERAGVTIITPAPPQTPGAAETAVPVKKTAESLKSIPHEPKPTPTPFKPTPTPVQKPLNWNPPPTPHLILEAGATITNDIATYEIYPINFTNRGLWDLRITLPIPENAPFLVASAPTGFITNFDGRSLTFTATQLMSQGTNGPLRFQLSVKQASTPIKTRASATWHYVDTDLGFSVYTQESTKSGELTVQPHTVQQIVADTTGDVPFPTSDLTNATLEQDQSNLKITLSTVGVIGRVGAGHIEYNVNIDNDCDVTTGTLQRNALGVDYRIRYQHDRGLASLSVWDKDKVITDTNTLTDTGGVTGTHAVTTGVRGGWEVAGSLSAIGAPNSHSITIWAPRALLPLGEQICWSVDTQDRSDQYIPKPPADQMPKIGGKLLLNRYNVDQSVPSIALSTPITETIGYTANGTLRLVRVITPTLALAPPDFSTVKGSLALSLVNDQSDTDVHIFALPDGQEKAKIANAGRPQFKFDGQHLLITRKDGAYEYALADKTEVQLSRSLSMTHPFYNAGGTTVVYENVTLTNTQGADNSKTASPLFQLCDLRADPGATAGCQFLPNRNTLATTKLPGELRGAQPVWTADDTIIYQGCATWMQPDNCGIYLLGVPKASDTNELLLRQLTHGADDLPTATTGNVVAFASQATGNWEVYAMRIDGAWVKNLSQDAKAQDVLPTISPDGNWIAFLSNRSGKWAVWVMPIVSGEPRKLFDLPGDKPWGDQDKGWQDQRLSWGS